MKMSPHSLFYSHKFEEAYRLYIDSKEDPESLFYAALCLEKLNKHDEANLIRKQIFEQFPNSPFAEESLFFYLLETKSTDFHLLEGSQYLSYFLFLEGEKAFKSEDFITSKNKFIKACALLERPKNSYFFELKHRTFLNLAKIEYALSQKEEKGVHIEYGLAYLRQSMREETAPEIAAERDFLFAVLYSEKNEAQALKWIDKCLKKYDAVAKDPFLFKLLKLKGELLQSIEILELGEKAFSPQFLQEEDLLEVWLLKARIYFKNKDSSSALNQLGTIINSPVVSIKRLEAMVLRQEVFKSMGRIDLASRHARVLQTLRKELEYGKLDLKPQ